MIKICVVTSNRADYSKLEPIIEYLHNSNNYELYLIVIGCHLVDDFGFTVNKINYPIYDTINTISYCKNRKTMPESVSSVTNILPQILDKIKPDACIVHGDRFDIIGVAITSALMNICLIHIEGGELSGTIDEHLRHSISKLASYHFVSNKKAKNILLQMGENEESIFIVGCPSYDKIINMKYDINVLNKYNFEKKNYIISIYHPVITDLEKTIKEYEIYINGLIKSNRKILFFYPNIDNGNISLIRLIRQLGIENNKNFTMVKSLDFEEYINLLRYSSIITGNSSSGIRESCIFGIPAINIGKRQLNRSQGKNITNLLNITLNNFINTIEILYNKDYDSEYLYGGCESIKKIAKILSTIDFKYKEKIFNFIS